MSYGADFANADPANAPLDGPLFIGADPFVWSAILLGLAAALLLGWYLGARSNHSRADAAHAARHPGRASSGACRRPRIPLRRVAGHGRGRWPRRRGSLAEASPFGRNACVAARIPRR